MGPVLSWALLLSVAAPIIYANRPSTWGGPVISRDAQRLLMQARLAELDPVDALDQLDPLDDVLDEADRLVELYEDPPSFEVQRRHQARQRMKVAALTRAEALFEGLRHASLQDVQALGLEIQRVFHPARRYRRRARSSNER